MFIDSEFLYLTRTEVVLLSTCLRIVLAAFLTYMGILWFYWRNDWQSAISIGSAAGKAIQLINSPSKRHGSRDNSLQLWIISTAILVIILACNYTDTMILAIWAPTTKEFSRPIFVDLSKTYNRSIPYDLYQQYSDGSTFVPERLLDSRFNPMLSNATQSESEILGQPTTYFKIDYDSYKTMEASINGSKQCIPVSPQSGGGCLNASISFSSLCTGIIQVYNTTNINYNLSKCNGTTSPDSVMYYDRPILTYALDIFNRSGNMVLDVTRDRWYNERQPETTGPNTLYKFRQSSVPYYKGRGLMIQYEMIDFVDFDLNEISAPLNSTTQTWNSTQCSYILKGYGMTDAGNICSGMLNDANYMFTDITRNLDEVIMKYCYMRTMRFAYRMRLECGMQYLNILYLGVDLNTAKPASGLNVYIQQQGDISIWADQRGTLFQYKYDNVTTGRTTLSSRGYGARTHPSIEIAASKLEIGAMDEHFAMLNQTFSNTNELFLREYSIGDDDYLYNGKLVPATAYLSVTRFECRVVVFAVIVALCGICAISIVFIQYRVLPNYYQSSALDTIRVATAPGRKGKMSPGGANQNISLYIDDEGVISVLNNGVVIGPTKEEYPLSKFPRDGTQDPLLSPQ